MQWVSRSLVLLAAFVFVVGCSRALEEKLEGKERELAEIRTTLAEIEGTLAASEAARAKDTGHLQQVGRQREELMGQVTALDNQRMLLERELARSRDELAERQQDLQRLTAEHQTLASQLNARDAQLQQVTRAREELAAQVQTLEGAQTIREQ